MVSFVHRCLWAGSLMSTILQVSSGSLICRELDSSSTYRCPTFRYCPWSTLPFSIRRQLKLLGYVEDGWNLVGNTVVEVETMRYADLAREQRAQLRGVWFRGEKHDCCNNHYAAYDWADLVEIEKADDARALGFTESSWTVGVGVSDTRRRKSWELLTEDEKAAARRMCYNRETWNGVPLQLWPDVLILPGQIFPEPTPSPTGAPTVSSRPTASPTTSAVPTDSPTPSPTSSPTDRPTPAPTTSPTERPTSSPTERPTPAPTTSPTERPTPSPTESPTERPTPSPTESPTVAPTRSPTESPTKSPTNLRTRSPTKSLVSDMKRSPTAFPTVKYVVPQGNNDGLCDAATETLRPSAPSGFSCSFYDSNFGGTKAKCEAAGEIWTPYDCATANSFFVSYGGEHANALRDAWRPKCCESSITPASNAPTPSKVSTTAPTNNPTNTPVVDVVASTSVPTVSPTKSATKSPTKSATKSPTGSPTEFPTKIPTKSPTRDPTESPTVAPTPSPTESPVAASVPTATPTETATVYTPPPVMKLVPAQPCRTLSDDFYYYCPVERYCAWSHFPADVTQFVGAEIGYTRFQWEYFVPSMIDATYWDGLTERTRNGLKAFGYDYDRHDCCNVHYWEYGWSDFADNEGYEEVLAAITALGYDQTTWDTGASVEYADFWWADLPENVRDALYDGMCYTKETWDGNLPSIMWPEDADVPGSYNAAEYGWPDDD